jgi:NAD(P)-dependent dehydrogenase (short-subunit alcohol dehydrogenase family)
MKDSPFRLQDKTILLTGPFNGVTQAMMRTMTELGADIAYVHEKAPFAAKYADGVNEAREARPDYGRAAYFDLPIGTESQIKDALSRVAEGIGRMDVYVDSSPLGWVKSSDVAGALALSQLMAQGLAPFFTARQRGRIIYLFEDSSVASVGVEDFVGTYQENLCEHISLSALSWKDRAVTVNGVALGVTEDFILRHFSKSGSIKKSLVELQSRRPGVKLVEAFEIATALAYLACPSSSSLTGQILRLTHGL